MEGRQGVAGAGRVRHRRKGGAAGRGRDQGHRLSTQHSQDSDLASATRGSQLQSPHVLRSASNNYQGDDSLRSRCTNASRSFSSPSSRGPRTGLQYVYGFARAATRTSLGGSSATCACGGDHRRPVSSPKTGGKTRYLRLIGSTCGRAKRAAYETARGASRRAVRSSSSPRRAGCLGSAPLPPQESPPPTSSSTTSVMATRSSKHQFSGSRPGGTEGRRAQGGCGGGVRSTQMRWRRSRWRRVYTRPETCS
jgi:hypothetical protein